MITLQNHFMIKIITIQNYFKSKLDYMIKNE